MSALWLELKIIKEDTIKILIVNCVFPILSTLLIFNVYQIFTELNLTNAFGQLFGAINNYNWMYWIILWFGYIILLLVIWKPKTVFLDYNILLFLRKKYLFWLNRLIITFFFTLIYLSLYFITVLFLFWSIGIELIISPTLVRQFFLILFNLYLHAVLWVLLKTLYSSRIASILLIIVFYGGVEISKPFIPLYYSFSLNFNSTMITIILIIEIGIILLLISLIVRIGLRKDYY